MNECENATFIYIYISTMTSRGTPAENGCSRLNIELTASWGVMSAFC
jgi:hypothetical protein